MKLSIMNLVVIIIVILVLIYIIKRNNHQENFSDLDNSNMFTYAGQNVVWVNDPNARTFNYISSDDANNLYIPNANVYANASLRYM